MIPSLKAHKRIQLRRRVLLGVWLLSGGAILARAGQLQIVQAERWQEAARAQQVAAREVAPPRGDILDRDGVPLATTREFVQVSVAPRELPGIGDPEARAALRRTLEDALDLSDRMARKVTDPDRAWVPVGDYPPSVRGTLDGLRGVYLTRKLNRDHPRGDIASAILGRVRADVGAGGVEQYFDDVLRGVPGRSVVARDPMGRDLPGQSYQTENPIPGGDVTLTLDADLQEIARDALAAAVDSTDAAGGELLISDPYTGALLAAVSMAGGRPGGLSFINQPYEPGSTAKPFTLAALLQHKRVRLDDMVDVGDGSWTDCRRTFHDVGRGGVLTLERAVQVSSNVAMAKVSRALSDVEQYENLRDWGFGNLTGITLPGESSGVLRKPTDQRWTCQSKASLAIGYEISVTPLQLVMAYGALANGGVLMEPRIVQEIRDREGRTWSFEPRPVRRVIPRRVALDLRDVLTGVVEEGTGRSVRLTSFPVAGKSGTTRYHEDGAYVPGRYYSSFVGFFPADAPQLVIYVKLDRARDYGGALAGPVIRSTMEAALAVGGIVTVDPDTPRTPDRNRGADGLRLTRVSTPPAAPRATGPAGADTGDGSPAPARRRDTPPGMEVVLPDLVDLPLRDAVRRLHALGLRVEVEGSGPVLRMTPGPGVSVATGDTVRLRSGRADP